VKSKVVLVIVILAIVAWALPNVAFGETAAMTYGWDDKLYRGTTNILTSPLEISQHAYKSHEKDGIFAGATIGVVKGLGHGITRLGAGIIEFVTFFVPVPEKDNAPLVEPEHLDLKIF